jgi:hypothetical protein
MWERAASTSSVVSGPQMALTAAIVDSSESFAISPSFGNLEAIVRSACEMAEDAMDARYSCV